MKTLAQTIGTAAPRHDPAADPMPYNPNGIGRCFPMPTDTPSLADHLEALRLDPRLVPTRNLSPDAIAAARLAEHPVTRNRGAQEERLRKAARERYYAKLEFRRALRGPRQGGL